MSSKTRPLVILCGPTGVGKSRTAVALALRCGGQVINADSMQVYRGFDIGTDKLPAAERRGVPHHLLDIVEATTQFTAADFVREALRAAAEIHERGRVPIVAGGTGLYLKALLEGLFPGPGRLSGLRRRLDAEAAEDGVEALWLRLTAVDPEYAAKIGRRDRVRIVRALEVFEATGVPFSRHFAATISPVRGFFQVRIGLQLERSRLVRGIEERVDRMFANGIVEEVRGLVARGVPEDAPPFRALGYRRVLAFLRGESTLARAVELTKTETRQYAKRQMTWFRRMNDIAWIPADDTEAVLRHVEARLR
ncbi:MAG: tRNA (adenosine(37)-N6)-dimethylallyltransferase MiaA [Candidatus Aminicenantes bacterium]|nr:tRNA (adenosine(37)-N6)-dimethylallyltransferase MiaA [Candidatus Aminicenantes bacterium]